MGYKFPSPYTGAVIKTVLDRANTGGAIDQALENKQDKLTFDSTPTEDSQNPVTSGGVYLFVGQEVQEEADARNALGLSVVNGKLCMTYLQEA